MNSEDSGRPLGACLSEKETERYFRRNEMLTEFARLFDYAEPSDRAIAIVGPAFLDSLLPDTLIEFMIDDEAEVSKLLQPEAPLGTFGSRVNACYCLGLIGPIVKADLSWSAKFGTSLYTTSAPHFQVSASANGAGQLPDNALLKRYTGF